MKIRAINREYEKEEILDFPSIAAAKKANPFFTEFQEVSE